MFWIRFVLHKLLPAAGALDPLGLSGPVLLA
jgi:hypothetical protein